MGHSLPARAHVVEMQHKYEVGDKVILTIEAVVTEQIPFTFIEPGYTVKVGKVALVVSERSLTPMPECSD